MSSWQWLRATRTRLRQWCVLLFILRFWKLYLFLPVHFLQCQALDEPPDFVNVKAVSLWLRNRHMTWVMLVWSHLGIMSDGLISSSCYRSTGLWHLRVLYDFTDRYWMACGFSQVSLASKVNFDSRSHIFYQRWAPKSEIKHGMTFRDKNDLALNIL